MQGLQWSVLFAVALAWSTQAAANPVAQTQREFYPPHEVKTAQRVADPFIFMSADGLSAKTYEVEVPGANFVKLHFNQFTIPAGITVVVSNRDGSESYRYSNSYRDSLTFSARLGDDGKNSFSAMSISGDTAIVHVYGTMRLFDPGRHRLEIDSYMAGVPSIDTGPTAPRNGKDSEPGSTIENSCGSNERYDAICLKDTNYAEYDRSIPVALLITSTGEVCTAWRVGPDNRLFTAEHCISDQSDLDGSEIWFGYVNNTCGGSDPRDEDKVTGKELLAVDWVLDYALFSVNDFSEISNFGYIGLDVRNGAKGEGIFIPQHGLGQPRQIAFESDMNTSGYCEIDDADFYGYEPGSDIGYFCDTTTSSSGAPVISSVTGKAIALHHLGGCFNAGSKVSLIWPQVSEFFNGVPDGDIPWNDDEETGNKAPTAEFDVSCDSLSCEFDASASKDSDGVVLGYSWTIGDGSSASGKRITHEFAVAGDYDISLVVKDNNGAKGSLAQTITVSVPNTGPTAKFSVSCIGLDCKFDASGSFDDDGIINSWSWTLGDGGSASVSQIDHSYAEGGSYTVSLKVKDNDGASDVTNHTVSLSSPNLLPIADFTFDCDELVCSFDASSSDDPDGEITTYQWSFGDGSNGSGLTASHAFKLVDNYVVTLTVEDEDGAIETRTRTVSTNVSNSAPEASFIFECSENNCVFDAGSSTDKEGQIKQYQWSLGDGNSASGKIVEYQYPNGGQFNVTLTVEDAEGVVDSRTHKLNISMPSDGPVADFSYSCTDKTCTLDAGSSAGNDHDIASYDWDFGDGAVSHGQTGVHKFTASGNYRVQLTVTDTAGASGTQSRTIKIKSPDFELSGSVNRQRARKLTTLRWAGAESETVEIYRNGAMIATTRNNGKYIDMDLDSSVKTAHYYVCETPSERCTDEIRLVF